MNLKKKIFELEKRISELEKKMPTPIDRIGFKVDVDEYQEPIEMEYIIESIK